MRVDKFLKVSRLIKRRTVANEACDGHRIKLNGNVVKPSKEVKVGDILSIGFGNKTLTVRILSVNDKASKQEAQEMYEVVDEG